MNSIFIHLKLGRFYRRSKVFVENYVSEVTITITAIFPTNTDYHVITNVL